MTKQLKPGEYPIDYPIPLADMAIGRNWIREKYSNKYEYYDNQAFMFWEDYLSNIALAAFKWETYPQGLTLARLSLSFLIGAWADCFRKAAVFCSRNARLLIRITFTTILTK